ncbi:MAG: outer membrane protein assembly factor BamA [Deltaproteobacteria bacterium]|nr:outer membrane protein assembly factor BamA [Deltaproteobacteria bacterium]
MKPPKGLCWVLLVALLCPMPWVAHAGGQTIKGIAIVGNQSVSTAAIQAVLQSRVGQPYDPATVEADLRALFKRGGFADIRVERESVGGGVRLIYHVVERPTVLSIRFEGNKKIKEKDLREKITIREYRALGGEELARAVETMHQMYEEKRFFLVDIDYDLQPREGGADLVFRIKEHGKAGVRRVQFVGNHVFSDRDLKKVLKTKERGSFPFRRGKFDREGLAADLALLGRHYLNHGYLRIHIAEPQIEISKDKRHIFLTFTIDEGQQYRVKDIRVEGDIVTTPEEVRALITTKPGEIYKHELVETDLQKLNLFYGTLGYAFANVQPIPMPNDTDGTADLIFAISKGRRVWIDRININGNSSTRDKVIRREVLVKEGDLFNRQLIEDSRAQLMQLGYFENVDIATPRGRRPDSVDLNFTVKERPTGTFNVGAGFSTAESFFLTASVSKENFFGRGLSGQLAVELSKIRQQYIINMTDPHFLDSDWILSAQSSRTVYRYPEYDRRAFGGGFSLGHRFMKNFTASLGYHAEDVKALNFQFTVPEVFRQNASGLTSSITGSLSYDTRDNRIYPRKGLFVNVFNEVSGTKLGGDNDFYRINGAARFYQPIWKGVGGRLFGKVGYIKSLGDRSVPLYERYLLGGPNSMRGFNFWTVGPSLRIPTGPTSGDARFVYGGNKMVQMNAEIEVPLYEPAGLKAVAFVDVGNAFAEDEPFSARNLRSNYGMGLRWLSPLGPLRFEWGFPFKRRDGEARTVFNFTIGEFN